MVNKYLAKSKGYVKTIKQHTEDLIKQYNIIKDIYPEILSEEEWEILKFAIYYHDLGKMNTKFQNKLYKSLKYDEYLQDDMKGIEIYHNFLSPLFIDTKFFEKEFGRENTKVLLTAIYNHHNREEREYNLPEVILDLEKQLGNFSDFKELNLEVQKVYPLRYIMKTTNKNNIDILNSKKYIMVKGLLNRIDYVASLNNEKVNVEESPIDLDGMYLGNKMKRIFQEKYRNNYRPVQEYMMNNKDENLIVVSPTGSGKTEAAILWIDNSKAFYTLPLKVSINQIYKRIKNGVNYQKTLLLHSDAFSYYINESREDDEAVYNYDRAKRLAAPLIVTTVDQLFKIVFKYVGYEEVLSALSYSKVVIDEIQMYSPQILAYILIGLKMITQVGGKFVIMTATFPPVIYDLMDKLQIIYKKQDAYFPMHLEIRHKICVLQNSEIDIEKVKENGKNKKVLVLVNTIKKAQELYDKLDSENIYLLHSNFLKKDRSLLEDKITNFTKENNNECGIWISTQIVEASLDLDFDILFTEMCSIDSLFQRMGRVFRKRNYYGIEPNVYIYDTKNGVRGANPIIDPEIYLYSLNEIIKYDGKFLSESDKQSIISQIFDFKLNPQLKESKYYKSINQTINIFYNRIPNQVEKNDIINLFRNIQNISLMPSKIYNEINDKDLIGNFDKSLKYENYKIKEKISEFCVNVTWRQNLEYEHQEMFYKGSNIYKTNYKYDFDEENLKGKGLILEKDFKYDVESRTI